jgi:hypothetical protein
VFSYAAQQTADSLTLNFSKAADFKISGKAPATLPRIIGFSTTKNSAMIQFGQDQSVRHFVIGKRVIVDIKGKAGKPADTPAKQPAAPAPEKPSVEKPKEPLSQTAEAAKPPAPVAMPKEKLGPPAPVPSPVPAPAPVPDASKAINVQAVPPAQNDTQPMDAHMINITATEAVGLAAFERFGTLWIILDHADYPIFPQIAGPQKDKFPPFERIPLTGATAFKLKLPSGLKIYGEGGGLIWKIIATPTPRVTDSLSFKRDFDQAQKPGGRLIWPANESRRIIDVPDQEIGDVLKVVTVASSRDYSGSEQDFVELATLDTYVGLAFRPKVDDLQVTRMDKGIIITRPEGLALSPETDLTSLKLQMKQKEGEQKAPPQLKGSKEAFNPFTRIFAFDRWLMGGPAAL